MYLGSNLTKEAEVEEQLRPVGQHSEERAQTDPCECSQLLLMHISHCAT